MSARITTEIDMIDNCKLERMACRIGISTSDAARILLTDGVDFFLSLLVGATNKG